MDLKELKRRYLKVVVLYVLFVTLITALLKLLFPPYVQTHLYVLAAVIQILYCFFLPYFYEEKWIWLASVFGYSAILGFSLYYFVRKMSCGCVGVAFKMDPEMALFLLLQLIAASCLALKWCGFKGSKSWMITSATSAFIAIVGYAIALQIAV